ncbi:fluoride efflux transporter CrcB [Motiliproteus sp. MSK22-1]|uniref:fluoride efflux transporter CrcB n=1 Tax=Motiliproteus sp. MSK22-1 TaxID=1897630 RepID=UPI00097651EF|nr:fluoride efflux transporter CrcB [Motiliproteus sp. MSK22-1]OMH32720.1 camphor resistance protein CrcB [Motiliproteus sp. MSK22-1]
MQQLLSIAGGGALGALLRYWVSGYVVSNTNHYLPLGTFTVNVLGSLLMGVCFVLIMEKSLISADFRPLMMVGLLGAFTTFSTFSLETVVLLQEGHIMSAAIYILLSVICCTAALFAGIWFSRVLF